MTVKMPLTMRTKPEDGAALLALGLHPTRPLRRTTRLQRFRWAARPHRI